MKKFIVLSALLAVGVLTAAPTFAAITVSAPRVVSGTGVNLTGTGFYGIYNASSGLQESFGSLPGTAVPTVHPGVFTVVESVADQEGLALHEVTATSQTSLQVTPDFSSASGVATGISGGPFENFLTGIGSFLIAELPAILTILACLIGLGFLLVRVRRWIGSKA